MIYNNINVSKLAKVLRVRHSLTPPILNLAKRLPDKKGTKHIRTELGERFVDIELGIKKADRAELREFCRQLAGILYAEEPQKLYLRDEPDKYYMAKLNGSTPLWEFHGLSRVILQFLCNDPLAYGDTKTIDISNSPAVMNGGTYPAIGTITVEISEPTSNISVTLQNTGEFVYISHNFIAGDMVLIDLEEEMVYKNGHSIMYDCALDSDFFSIPVGESTINVSSGNAMLEFIERWL